MIRTAICSALIIGFAFVALKGDFAHAVSVKSDLLMSEKSDLLVQLRPTQIAQVSKLRLNLQQCALEDCSDTPQ